MFLVPKFATAEYRVKLAWGGHTRKAWLLWDHETKLTGKEQLCWREPDRFGIYQVVCGVWLARIHYSTPRQLTYTKSMHILDYLGSCTDMGLLIMHCDNYNMAAERAAMARHDKEIPFEQKPSLSVLCGKDISATRRFLLPRYGHPRGGMGVPNATTSGHPRCTSGGPVAETIGNPRYNRLYP
jgi:hypothetical protein